MSVILCTRNGHRKGFLEEALRSVLEQSAPPAEVILVDDGSTDGTAVWVRQNFPRVRVLINDGIGLAAGRNTGIKAAQSPWIAFIDDDDVWCPDKLAEQLVQVDVSSRPEATIWVARAAVIHGNSDSQRTPVLTPLYLAGWPACLLGCPVWYSGALLPAALLWEIGPFDESLRYGSAYQYWIRCLLAGVDVCYSERILLLLRRHQNQMTAPPCWLANMLEVDDLLMPFLEKLSPVLSRRIRMAHMLTVWCSLAWTLGPAPAARYWAATPLQPGWFGLRVLAYFLLDTAAYRAPLELGQRLRRWASRLLLGSAASTDTSGNFLTLDRDHH